MAMLDGQRDTSPWSQIRSDFFYDTFAAQPCTAAGPAWRRGLQSSRPVGRVAEPSRWPHLHL